MSYWYCEIKKCSLNFIEKRKERVSKSILVEIEKSMGMTIQEIKSKFSEERLFLESLKHITTTKKALCAALLLNVENCCRYKRTAEKEGRLVQSVDEVICPYTGFSSHLISTNPSKFQELTKSNSNQLNLF